MKWKLQSCEQGDFFMLKKLYYSFSIETENFK